MDGSSMWAIAQTSQNNNNQMYYISCRNQYQVVTDKRIRKKIKIKVFWEWENNFEKL